MEKKNTSHLGLFSKNLSLLLGYQLVPLSVLMVHPFWFHFFFFFLRYVQSLLALARAHKNQFARKQGIGLFRLFVYLFIFKQENEFELLPGSLQPVSSFFTHEGANTVPVRQ